MCVAQEASPLTEFLIIRRHVPHIKLGNYAEAVKWHEQSLQVRKAIHGEGTNHIGIDISLLSLSIALQNDPRSFEYRELYMKIKAALDKANSGK